jgi:hypothetical protein
LNSWFVTGVRSMKKLVDPHAAPVEAPGRVLPGVLHVHAASLPPSISIPRTAKSYSPAGTRTIPLRGGIDGACVFGISTTVCGSALHSRE